MPKYLVSASYTASGAAGLLKEGGTGRVAAIKRVVESGGGTLEACYWVMGKDDIILIVDAPDTTSIAAVSLTVSASGAATCTSAELLTAEQMDEVSKRTISYRAPGT